MNKIQNNFGVKIIICWFENYENKVLSIILWESYLNGMNEESVTKERIFLIHIGRSRNYETKITMVTSTTISFWKNLKFNRK